VTSLALESASQLARRIRAREISSRELTELYIGRIERYDGAVNAVVVRDFERARQAADAADAALARGDLLGPLHGLPLTVKEAYDVEGLPTTWGAPEFAGNVARSDAETVRRLRAAGAHVLGKTNVPLQLGDIQTYNALYGTTRNPWNLERSPGGSSGGSAAALAAGLTALASGSDIGGSIRNPAHFCGVYGHKPTWGIVPDQGHALPGMDASPDVGVVGPMARSAEDLALALEIVSGPDAFRAPAWRLALPRPAQRRLADLRIALWPSHELAPVAAEISDRVQQLGDRLARLGASVSDAARPDFDPSHGLEVYLHLLNGVISAGFPDEVYERLARTAAALDPGDRSLRALSLRSSVQRHRDWVRMDHARARLRKAWSRFFEDFDLLVCPIAPVPAFPHDHSPIPKRTLRVDGRERPYMEQLFWAGLASGAHLPSTAFPTGLSREGLPIGLQAIGAELRDHTGIEFARLLALELGGFQPPPGYAE
jgi:amidase